METKYNGRIAAVVSVLVAVAIVVTLLLVGRNKGEPNGGQPTPGVTPTAQATTSATPEPVTTTPKPAPSFTVIPGQPDAPVLDAVGPEAEDFVSITETDWLWNPPPGVKRYRSGGLHTYNFPETLQYWQLRPWLDIHREPYGTGKVLPRLNMAELEPVLIDVAWLMSIEDGEALQTLDEYRARVKKAHPYMQVDDLVGPGRLFGITNPVTLSRAPVDGAQFIFDTEDEAYFTLSMDLTHLWRSEDWANSSAVWCVVVAERDGKFVPVRGHIVELEGFLVSYDD